nr:MAG TPA: hypothetical protein [Caudoviricetes sp.]
MTSDIATKISRKGRLPTILLYRIPKIRRRARASALFGNSERKSS